MPDKPSGGRPRVFVGRPLPDAGLDLVRAACDVEVWPGPLPPPREAIVEGVRGVDGILALLTDRIDGAAMEAAGPGLRVISNFAVGVDNVDIAEATRRGIPVGNTPGVLTEATADLAWALLMAAARRIPQGDRYVRDGNWRTWEPTLFLGADVHGATLGIVGFGRIGQAMARRARGFDMRVLFTNRSQVNDFEGGTQVELITLLREGDFVSIHTPLTQETHHFFDAAALGAMKPGAVLINTARGPVVDPDALYDALSTGHLGAAALDVTEPEPLPSDHPLLRLENCVVLPHLGSATGPTRDLMARMAAENLLAGLAGQRLPNCVNPEVYG